MKEILEKLVNKKELEREELLFVFSKMFSGELSESCISAFLVLFRAKGESVNEIFHASLQMRNFATKIESKYDLIDTCGTGGDSLGTFNISTTCAFVLSGAGLHVAKHGNRSNSSKSGSSDLLNALGVKIDIDGEKVLSCVENVGIGFLFAPIYHQAMKHVIGVRKEIGIRTIFNLLGPLTNPMGAKYQVIGVFSKEYLNIFAQVLLKHGCKSALIVHGNDGMDEITLTSKTYACELKDEKICEYEIDPRDFGFSLCKIEELNGGSPQENAEITIGILSGKLKGPKRDIVLLNSAAGLKTSGKVSSLIDGVKLANEIIDSGKALDKLNMLIKHSNNC